MKNKFLVFCGLIFGIMCFTVVAMVINIKTLTVLDQTKQLNQHIKQLKQENKKLEHKLAMATSYTKLSAKIKELNLIRPAVKKITHIVLPLEFKNHDE